MSKVATAAKVCRTRFSAPFHPHITPHVGRGIPISRTVGARGRSPVAQQRPPEAKKRRYACSLTLLFCCPRVVQVALSGSGVGEGRAEDPMAVLASKEEGIRLGKIFPPVPRPNPLYAVMRKTYGQGEGGNKRRENKRFFLQKIQRPVPEPEALWPDCEIGGGKA
jgi:hypothetical protein